MTSQPERAPGRRRGRKTAAPVRGIRPRLVAGAFVAIFALSIATVIYTGLNVEAPRTELAAGLPVAGIPLGQPHIVNLVFSSATSLDDVMLLVTLPDGVELIDDPGRHQMQWRTRLEVGRNVLPLELVARTRTGGQLAVQMSHGEQRKLFRVHLQVAAE